MSTSGVSSLPPVQQVYPVPGPRQQVQTDRDGDKDNGVASPQSASDGDDRPGQKLDIRV